MKESEIKNVSAQVNTNKKSVNIDNLFTFSNEKELSYNAILTNESQNKNEYLFNCNFQEDYNSSNNNKKLRSNLKNFNGNRNNLNKNSFEKRNLADELSTKPLGNDINNIIDNNYELKKPLLSSIKNNTKNTFSNENFLINNSEIKKDSSIKTKFYESNNFLNSINNPKISNAFVLNYENNVLKCNNICVNTCTKTNFIDLVNIENEEIFEDINKSNTRINPKHFVSSSKSYFILIITVFISSFHFCLYRKLSYLSQDLYKDQDNENQILNTLDFLTKINIISDINIFTWRFQMISFLLFFYILITNYFTKNNYSESLEGRFTILEDIKGNNFSKNNNSFEKKLHMIYLNYNEIVTFENIKNVGILCSSIFLLFFSSLFIPISMCLAIQYLTILMKFFYKIGLNFEKKSNKLFRLIIYILTMIGLLMCLSNDFFTKDSTIANVYDNKHDQNHPPSDYQKIEKDVNDSKLFNINKTQFIDFDQNVIKNDTDSKRILIQNSSADSKNTSFFVNLLGMTISFLSGLINIFWCEEINKNYLCLYSSLEYLVILNFNATIIMTFLNFILNSYHGNPLYSISWMFQNEKNLTVYLLIFGVFAFLNIMFTIFSSVYLNETYLKFLKIFEIPLADTIAISILSVYNYTNEINYHIGLINLMIAIVLLEFYELFTKKSNSKKYDF